MFLLPFPMRFCRVDYPANTQYSNKADLRVLSQIHKQLGIKSPDALLLEAKNRNSPSIASKAKPRQTTQTSRAQRNLKIFASVLRAIARMSINARSWARHEKTRMRLVAAWEDTKKREPIVRRLGFEAHDKKHVGGAAAGADGAKVQGEIRTPGRKAPRKANQPGDDCVEIRL
jgi:hypothetical protein